MRNRDRAGQFWVIMEDSYYARHEKLAIFVIRSDDLIDDPIVHECLITSNNGRVRIVNLREFLPWEESDRLQRIY